MQNIHHISIAVIPLFLARKPEVQEVWPGLHCGVRFSQSLPEYQVGGGGGDGGGVDGGGGDSGDSGGGEPIVH